LLLGFSSGLQLVYKPRPLEAEAGFQALLRWLNGCGFSPGFRALSVSQKEGYGWCEYVEAEDCHSSTQVNRFYARLGGQLALLYVLEATDFHFENLVAEGEHPVLVDLETLFHPRLGAQKDAGADPMAALERSVLRVGLLPHKRWQTAESAGIDLSGLGADSGQLTPFGVPSWDNAGTDEIRLVRRPQLVPSHPNRPLLDGASVDPVDGLDAFVDGFRSVWTMVSQHSTAFLSRDGPLRALVGAPVRVVMRATQTYDILLRESFHPDLLRDALDRDELLNRLWAQVPSSPYLADVLPSEMADLHRGDIPYFTTYPYSRHVWDSSGEKIPGILDRASLEYVRDRVARLGQEELDKQVWFIRASLATMGTRPQFQRRPYCAGDDRPELVAREDLLAEACAIGDRLQALSLRSGDQIGWVGLTLRTKDQWSLVPLGLDLYDGLPGVALFFAYLGEITQEPRYVECARVTATTISAGLDRNLSPLRTNGGFNGLGGDLYFLTHLAALWGEPSLRSQAYALLDPIAARVEQDISFDIIGGAAGCIAALLALSRAPGMAHSDRAIELATQCGEHLLRHSHRESSGIGWLNPYISPKPLAGFAHGAAGIAWALSELAAATDDERFRVAAHDAVTYEDSLFSEAEGNWADLRELEPSSERSQVASDQRYTTAWCHGAPGIGLGRLGMLNRMRLPELRVPIESALLTTMEQAFGVNHSLCHGDLGSLEFIAQSSKTFDEGWRVRAGALTGAILERMRSGGWLCGNPLRVESPGLMTGLAGIGYGLLRSAVPDRVPSVLTLEPPVA